MVTPEMVTLEWAASTGKPAEQHAPFSQAGKQKTPAPVGAGGYDQVKYLPVTTIRGNG